MTASTSVTPDEFLDKLMQGATTRKRRSLELIHKICKEQHARKSADFSIATIGRLSSELGGPSAQPIRNAAGADYRALIEVWAKYADASTRKRVEKSGQSSDEELLKSIHDPVVRALVGANLRELSKLRGEVTLLKTVTRDNVIIDLRDKAPCAEPTNGVLVVTPLDGLLKTEIEAIRYALSSDFLRKMGWLVGENGQITQDGRTIFKPGFATGLRKILGEVRD